jgi:hypothetical protein
VRSKRGKDLSSIDENDDDSVSSTLSSSLHTLSSFLSQDFDQEIERERRRRMKEKKKREQKEKTASNLSLSSLAVRTPPDSYSRGGVALTPLMNPLSRPQSPALKIGGGLSNLKPSEELQTFRLPTTEREALLGSHSQVDCETPRVITWTDLSFDPREYSASSSSTKPIVLKSLSIGKKVMGSEQERGEGQLMTSRSDESDYEAEWERAANRNILK